jgi:phytoene/squalene synthetase
VAEAVHRAQSALAAALYLDDAISSYRQAARFGRVVFPVDELLAANIENADLCAAEPPVHLQSYLAELRGRTLGYCSRASAELPRSEHGSLRHLLVLAALGARRASRPQSGPLPLRDLYLAWSTARRAARRS